MRLSNGERADDPSGRVRSQTPTQAPNADSNFQDVRGSLLKTRADLENLLSSLDPTQQQRLEMVPVRFLEWTMQRVQHLSWAIAKTDRHSPPLETVSLSARLLVEALWILRWIGQDERRAKEYALAGYRDMSEVGQVCIVQSKDKLPALAEKAIENQRAIEADAAKQGAALEKIGKWPVGSDLLRKKLQGDKVAGFENSDRRDWDTVYAVSVYLHPSPVFVMASAEVSRPENVLSIADCAARIASDIAAHLLALYGTDSPGAASGSADASKQ